MITDSGGQIIHRLPAPAEPAPAAAHQPYVPVERLPFPQLLDWQRDRFEVWAARPGRPGTRVRVECPDYAHTIHEGTWDSDIVIDKKIHPDIGEETQLDLLRRTVAKMGCPHCRARGDTILHVDNKLPANRTRRDEHTRDVEADVDDMADAYESD